MAQAGGFDRKVAYLARVKELFSTYNKIMLVEADFVGSAQMQEIRKSLRPDSTLLMGKNTLIRKALRELGNSTFDPLLPLIKGNVGLVFTDGDLTRVLKVIKECRKGAPAKADIVAPCDVYVPAGRTSMEPGQTSFLQALNIPTKINRGTIEILQDVQLIWEGKKVSSSAATLLQKLDIRPFEYGLEPTQVFDDGVLYKASLLDADPEEMIAKFKVAVQNIASLCLAANYPTIASIPHSLANGYKNVLAISVETEYTFEGSEQIKEFIANPELAAAAAAAAAPAAAADEAAPAEEEEEEEESDEDMGFGLFD